VRSFGPMRAALRIGPVPADSNAATVVLAMIETPLGLKNVAEICATPGLDGVYVGPSDLALSLGKPSTLAPDDPEVLRTMAGIAEGARRHGLIAGVHVDGPATALQRYEEGFHFCTLLNDVRLLVDAARRMVGELRGAGPAETSKTY